MQVQELDTEVVVATASGTNATAVSANIVVDERQMNALFLDVVSYNWTLKTACKSIWKVQSLIVNYCYLIDRHMKERFATY